MQTIDIQGDLFDFTEALNVLFSDSDASSMINLLKPDIIFCEDCLYFYVKEDARPWKLEPDTMLCDSCHDLRRGND